MDTRAYNETGRIVLTPEEKAHRRQFDIEMSNRGQSLVFEIADLVEEWDAMVKAFEQPQCAFAGCTNEATDTYGGRPHCHDCLPEIRRGGQL